MKKNVENGRCRRWRGRTKLYALAALIIVSALIYWEQAALLYVVSTFMICLVLFVVAFADLEGKDKQLARSESSDASEISAQ